MGHLTLGENTYSVAFDQRKSLLDRHFHKKNPVFSALASKLNIGFNQQGFFGGWGIYPPRLTLAAALCKADVSSVSPSSELTEGLWGNRSSNSRYNLCGPKSQVVPLV